MVKIPATPGRSKAVEGCQRGDTRHSQSWRCLENPPAGMAGKAMCSLRRERMLSTRPTCRLPLVRGLKRGRSGRHPSRRKGEGVYLKHRKEWCSEKARQVRAAGGVKWNVTLSVSRAPEGIGASARSRRRQVFRCRCSALRGNRSGRNIRCTRSVFCGSAGQERNASSCAGPTRQHVNVGR